MVKRLKSYFETLENPALWKQLNVARLSTLGKQQFVPRPPPPLSSATITTLCPPFATPNRRQCTEFPPTYSRALISSLFLSLLFTLSSSSIRACMTILWVSSKFRLLLSIPSSLPGELFLLYRLSCELLTLGRLLYRNTVASRH